MRRCWPVKLCRAGSTKVRFLEHEKPNGCRFQAHPFGYLAVDKDRLQNVRGNVIVLCELLDAAREVGQHSLTGLLKAQGIKFIR